MAHLAPTKKWDARLVDRHRSILSRHVELTAFDPLNRYLGPVPHDSSYYAKCLLGGVLACGTTHAGITPLDVTKCNMQVRVSPPSKLRLGPDLSLFARRRSTPQNTRVLFPASEPLLPRRASWVLGKASDLP